jgi:hypothetical protein
MIQPILQVSRRRILRRYSKNFYADTCIHDSSRGYPTYLAVMPNEGGNRLSWGASKDFVKLGLKVVGEREIDHLEVAR